MKTFAAHLWGLAVAIALAATLPAKAAKEDVILFAAASLTDVVTDIIKPQDEHVRASFASSSTLAKQIEAGAPADIFISANELWTVHLGKKGIGLSEPKLFARNSLILLAPKNTPLESENIASILSSPKVKRIAIAEPASVPLGIYSKAALTNLGIWQEIQTRTVIYAQSATTVVHWVDRGEVDIAIAYGTDAARTQNAKSLATFPEDSHPPIVYWVLPLKDTEKSRSLMSLLLSDEARDKLHERGFTR